MKAQTLKAMSRAAGEGWWLEYARTHEPHLYVGGREVCERCAANQAPFDAKPDVKRWIDWKLTDASWAKWRKENPEFVAEHTRKPRKSRAVEVKNG